MAERWEEQVEEWGRGELWHAIYDDAGDSPTSHWGRRPDDWCRIAFLLEHVYEACSGNRDDPDSVDSTCSIVVNDGDGRVAEFLVSYRCDLPEGWTHWVDIDDFDDNDEHLKEVIVACLDVARRFNNAVDGFELAAYAAAYEVAWEHVFDYWDSKEG